VAPVQHNAAPMSTESEAPKREVASGTIIDGRFEIVEPLGEGGMATVYRARQSHMDRMVAIKVLDIDPSALTREGARQFRERFLREARASARVDHPNIVTVHDFGFLDEGEPYLVMELIEGHDLEHEILHHGAIAPRRAIRLFTRVLEGLAVAHREGIVHRDLKPTNLLLKDPHQVGESLMILDFGIAQIQQRQNKNGKTGEAANRLTMPGQMLGTPAFLAPEFIRNQVTSPALDVYQMGLILVEMIAGAPAVQAHDPYEALRAHCEGDLIIPDWLRNSPLGTVLDKALAVDVEDRYRNATHFLRGVEGVADRVDEIVVPDDSTERPRVSNKKLGLRRRDAEARSRRRISSSNPTVLGEVPDDVVPTGRQRRRTAAVIVVVLLLGGAGAIAWILSTDTTSDAAPDPTPARAMGSAADSRSQTGPEEPSSDEPSSQEVTEESDDDPPSASGDVDETGDAGSADSASTVTVHVDVQPTGTTVAFDDEVVGSAPIDVELPNTMSTVELALSKDGYEPATVEIVPATTATVAHVLERIESTSPGKRPRESAKKKKRRRTKRKAAAEPGDGETETDTEAASASAADEKKDRRSQKKREDDVDRDKARMVLP